MSSRLYRNPFAKKQRIRRRFFRPLLESLEARLLLTLFTVDSADDFGDADLSDDVCGDSSHACTLRAAIEQANHKSDRDTIGFIPGLPTISPLSPLPPIVESVTIDGYTGGGTPNTNPSIKQGTNAQLTIELDGSLAGPGADGLEIRATRTIVTGLVINNFDNFGILIEGGEQNEIQGNFFGTDRTGIEAAADRSGVAITNSNNNRIGGTAPAHRNILSGNLGAGVILVGGSSENTVQGNYIGTDRTGTQRVSNFLGILFTSTGGGSSVYASNNLIGGTEPNAGNIISGNERDGVFVLRGDQNKVEGNFIGTDAVGMNALPNGRAGVRIVEGNNNIVGGTAPGAGNVVSGNDRSGIVIRVGDLFEDTPNPPLPNTSKDAIDNEIRGNLIGIDADGLKPLPNFENGILLDSVSGSKVVLTGTKIGGPTVVERNVISGNGEAGISIVGANTSASRVLGNFIGTDVSGRISDPDGKLGTDDELGNGDDGIFIDGSPKNVIGGLNASETNIISGNQENGIRILGKPAAENEILGNSIGTNDLAIAPLPNGLNGIVIKNAPNTQIGIANPGRGNIILGNLLNGIQIQGLDATGTHVENNSIGLIFVGLGRIGNVQNGVLILDDAHDNTIGGSDPFSGNRIVANGFGGTEPGHGIVIKSGTGNRIQRNSIYNNNGLGIDLGEDGPTPNDEDDSDLGANRLQNFATFTTTVAAGQTQLSGTLQSTPNSVFVVEFFSNVSGGPLDNHEGQKFLANTGVFTDGNGKAQVSITFSGVEKHVTATVTDIDGNTSEFARAPLLHGVEFTQAIQIYQKLEDLKKDLAVDGSPPIPIVAGKPLALRVYLNQLSDPAHVEIEAVGPGHTETRKGLLYRECDVTNQRRKDTLAVGTCFSADFTFDPPPGISTYTVTLKDNQGQVRESHEFMVDARLTKSLVLKEVSVCDTAPFNVNQCQPVGVLPSVVNGVDVDGLLREVMPTHQVDIEMTWHVILLNMFRTDIDMDGNTSDCFVFLGCEPRGWFHKVAREAQKLFTIGDHFVSPLSTVRYVGVTRPNLPGPVGVGKTQGAVFQSSFTILGNETIDELIAHEIGHTLGLDHTNVPVTPVGTAPGCWNRAPDASTDWPYANNQLQSGPATSPVLEVGYNVSTGSPVAPPNVFALMSYCSPNWISPHNYLKLVNAFTIVSGVAKSGRDQHQGEGEFWLVSGEIGEQGVVLDPLYVLDTEASLNAGEGTHRIVVQDAEGETLRERFFTPTASEAVTLDGEESVGTPSFSELVRVMPDAARIVLIDPSGAELHRVTLTGAAPVVDVDFAPAGDPLKGLRAMRWSVEDADDESHAFRIEYSADGGGSWASLGTELTEGELNVNFDRLAGSDGQALLRVYASDGVNSSHAVSKPFSVSFKLPSASIQQPAPDSEFDLGQNVVMRAAGFDMDDGYLDDDSLRWNSNLDGHLGEGSLLLVDDLSKGIHKITLLATDDSGNEVSDQVTISVADRIYVVGQHPGFLRFDSASFDVDEDAGEATITVVRDEGTSGTISVDYATVAGTALEGSDYTAVSGTLTFEDGQDTGEFTIPIIDNPLGDQSTTTVRVVLQNPSAATIIVAPKTAELLIHDDELANGTVFVVINTNDNGAGSLRQAINDANARPGTDFIYFDIPGEVVHTIRPLSPFPVLTGPVTIDGYSQPGAGFNTQEVGNNARLLVELDGSALRGTSNGLDLTAGHSIIRGLVINRFPRSGISIRSADGSIVEGNFIGTDHSGILGMGNGSGVSIVNSTANIIGGTTPEARNVISDGRLGVSISISSVDIALRGCHGDLAVPLITCNRVQGNYIGTAADGVSALGNRTGVSIAGPSGNFIGGTEPGAGNIIAFNPAGGVSIFQASKLHPNGSLTTHGGTENAVRGNSIFQNHEILFSGLKIGFGISTTGNDAAAPTLVNDPAFDTDVGPNDLQNHPVLHSAISADGSITIDGRLDSSIRNLFEIDFFSSGAMDPSGFGPGEIFLGSTTVGSGEFSATLPVAVAAGQFITATATNPRNSTSQFSARIEVGDVLTDTLVVNTTDDVDDGVCDTTHCSLREAIHGSNNHPGEDTITFDIPGGGVQAIQPFLNLPPTTDPVTIDGFTQEGASPNTLTVGSDAVPLIQIDGVAGARVVAGLNIAGGDSTVRGLIINGVLVQQRGDNILSGNFIGVDPSGTQVLGGGMSFVGSRDNTIGGTAPADRNVITSLALEDRSNRNTVQGNYFGTSASGLASLGQSTGLRLTDSGGNLIGGRTPAERNVISGNRSNAITMTRSTSNEVLGNFIGVKPDGVSELGNGGGIVIGGASIGNSIGGIEPGEGNIIAFSERTAGVSVGSSSSDASSTSRGNSIRGNSIFSNVAGRDRPGLGIDLLLSTDVTLNDELDRDLGGNTLQNFPILHAATNAAGSLAIEGRLASTPKTTFDIDLYSNLLMDPSGFGEGQTYIGSTQAITDPSGDGMFSTSLSVEVADGEFITATATSPGGNTSEFSARLAVGDVLADTLVVNATDDGDDGFCDATHCSLREAIHSSNNHPGKDLIAFDIPGEGVQTIAPLIMNLPSITDPGILDGYTQPGASPNTLADGNNAVMLIELAGHQLTRSGVAQLGLHVVAGDSVVRGLVMNRFLTSGIVVALNGANRIEGNFFGTDAAGTTVLGGGTITVTASSDNVIGGRTPDTRNLISGLNSGIRISGISSFGNCPADDPIVSLFPTEGNLVQGNYIGTDRDGTAALGGNGVSVSCAANNTIGGTTPEERNVISGGGNVFLSGLEGAPANNRVMGNYIGTDRTGKVGLVNGGGVALGSTGNIVGGTQPGAGNVIAGTSGLGVMIRSSGAEFSEDDVPLGGHVIQGNFIGTDKDGQFAIGNGGGGILVETAGNIIGGSEPGAGNVISGNGEHGILIRSRGFSTIRRVDIPVPENVVRGNLIGTGVDGESPLGNAMHGISLLGKALDNKVGGMNPGEGNVIAYNGGDGISTGLKVRSNETPPFGRVNRNAFLSNRIFSNFGIGIDLNDDGVTQNDSTDTDAGPNNLQNFPIITSVSRSGGSTTIDGTLNSRPNGTYRLEFFENVAFDPSNFGEGHRMIGSTEVTTAGDGNVSFSVTVPVTVPPSHVVTATATDEQGNTSEFSGRGPDEDSGATANLRVTKSSEPDSAIQGQIVTYAISVINDGPDEATNVSLIDSLPNGVVFDFATPSQGVCGAAGNSVICSLENLASAATATVEIGVVSTRTGAMTNTVSVASDQFDPDTEDNTTTAEIQVNPGADLSVSKFTFIPFAPLGASKTFTLTVTNNGPSFATGVRLIDTFPDSMTFSFASGVPQGTCSELDGIVTCELGSLASGAVTTVFLSARADELGVFTNRAEVTSNLADPDTSNNTASFDLTVAPLANLAISMTDDVSEVVAVGTLTYQIKVDNTGPQTAENVIAADILPTGVTLVSTSGCAEDPAGAPNCSLGDIPARGSAEYTLTVSVDAGTTGTLANQVSVRSDTVDPNENNNTAVDNTTVIRGTAPTFTTITSSSPLCGGVAAGDVVDLTASYSGSSTLNTHTAVIDWGDGTTSPGAVDESDGSGSIAGSHAYQEGGIFEVLVTVTDNNSGAATTTTRSQVTGVRRDPATGQLQVVGNDGDDHLSVTLDTSGAAELIKVNAEFDRNGPNSHTALLELAPDDVDTILTLSCGGDDTVTIGKEIKAGASVDTGSGNDAILIASPTAGLSVDAGLNVDSIELVGEAIQLDLTDPNQNDITDIEFINIAGNGRNSLTLSGQTVSDISDTSNTLFVLSNLDDSVDVGSGWALTGVTVEDGIFYRVLEQNSSRLFLNGPANWQNPISSRDVNNNGIAGDAVGDILTLINEVNLRRIISSTSVLPEQPVAPDFPAPFYDVNGDGFLTPVGDILSQINFVNSQAGLEGEHEFVWVVSLLPDYEVSESIIHGAQADPRDQKPPDASLVDAHMYRAREYDVAADFSARRAACHAAVDHLIGKELDDLLAVKSSLDGLLDETLGVCPCHC